MGVELLRAASLATDTVILPSGAVVRIRELSLSQRTAFAARSQKDPPSIGAWLIAASCIDESGVPLLTEAEVLAAGDTLSGQVMECLALAIMRLSGLIAGKD